MKAEALVLERAVLPAPAGLSDGGVVDELRRALHESRRWDARQTELIAEAERRGLAKRDGYGSTTAWLMAVSGEPAPVCRSQVAVAAALEQMPETRQAFAAGEVSESRVRVLAQAQALAPEQFADDEATLVAQVASASSQQVPRVLAAWKRTTDPEAAQAEAERLHQQRALHLSPGWSGMVHLNGDLDPEGGLIVINALRSLSEPAALDPSDTRTPAQRRADALVQICSGPDGRPAQPLSLLVTVPWNTLQTGKGVVDTEAGAIRAETARPLACDATISRVILDAESVPVEMGRATRVISPALRRALDLRDGHCTHPGCDMPPRYCDAHHIQHWADGGKTELSNLRLLCRAHHHHQPYPQRR